MDRHCLKFSIDFPPFYEMADFAHRINKICIPIIFGLVFLTQIVYEAPIRKCLDADFRTHSGSVDLHRRASGRLLNMPFFIIAIDLAG